MLSVIRKSMSEVSRAAHLWPPRLIGWNICCVNRLINQPCRVRRRLFSQRAVGLG